MMLLKHTYNTGRAANYQSSMANYRSKWHDLYIMIITCLRTSYMIRTWAHL